MTTYRAGNHNARNIYRDDEHMAVAFTPEDGLLIVAALNEAEHTHGPALSVPADSCTCTVTGPDPHCVVHWGRRAKGPKPPNLPGCICDGSGRTCPRHGAVI